MSKATINSVRRLMAELEIARKEFGSIARRFDQNNDSVVMNAELDLWEERTCQALIDFGASEAATKVRKAKGAVVAGEPEENLERKMDAKEGVLIALLNDVGDHPEFWKKKLESYVSPVPVETGHASAVAVPHERRGIAVPLGLVELICSRLDIVARQLQDRHEGRATLKIHDEYDVQDLLHSLLRLHFEDVRPEEWTPSYAGGAARMDFLLKTEQIVIEAKMARPGREAKKIYDELIVDAVRYTGHPDCKLLVCFVYDPEGAVKNPRGVEHDLKKISDSRLQVAAVIAP